MLKKSFLHPDILRRDVFTELSPLADELWFWAMTVLNDTKIKIPTVAHNKLIYANIDTQLNGETLRSENVLKGKNDLQLQRIIKRYPALLEKLIREDMESKPYLSVVMPVKNPATMPACFENIFWQTFPDFELILINCGARVEIPILPTNFHVVNYPGGSFVDALNLGLQKAAGDYVLFKDENSILPREVLDIAAQMADNSRADVIHFAGHIQLEGNNGRFVLDDAPELKRDTPMFFDAPKQLRSVLWLQNKLSHRLDTKIFKREFLIEHGITFGNDLAEFLFQALIQADKYLIAPQAFCFCK